MIQQLTLSAPAKLNLFLHITGRRVDGYHELQSAFQLLDFADELSFEQLPSDMFDVHMASADGRPIEDIPVEQNLIYRAAKLLAPYRSHTNGVKIQVRKRLPSGGGLGGGSSDAATTLLGLRYLWQLKLSDDALADIGLQLGADVPIFIRGHSAFAEGVGEHLRPITLPETWYAVIHPGVHVSTGAIFQHPKLPRSTSPVDINHWRFETTHNDCQNLVCALHPEVAKALRRLLEYAPARLTGTGACVFAGFPSQTDAQRALYDLPSSWFGFVARGLNQSPVCHQLRQASMSDSTTNTEV